MVLVRQYFWSLNDLLWIIFYNNYLKKPQFVKKELVIPKIRFGSGDILDHIEMRMSSDTPGKFPFSPIILIII